MRNFDVWTCGQSAGRLKDTSILGLDGQYQLLTAEHVFNDYLLSTNDRVRLPEPEAIAA
jgi:nitronate monooxygenase